MCNSGALGVWTAAMMPQKPASTRDPINREVLVDYGRCEQQTQEWEKDE